MELNYFKDMLFDAINECADMNISDIEADDRKSVFMVTALDGSRFAVLCKTAGERELCNKCVEKR